MGAVVTRLRPREFYAVVPGSGVAPGQDGEPEPLFYERTLNGLTSAMAHARFLSSGGAEQSVTLTEGRRTRMILRFVNGTDMTGKVLPPAYRTTITPGPGASLRPGAPRGRITEISRHKMARTRRKGDNHE